MFDLNNWSACDSASNHIKALSSVKWEGVHGKETQFQLFITDSGSWHLRYVYFKISCCIYPYLRKLFLLPSK